MLFTSEFNHNPEAQGNSKNADQRTEQPNTSPAHDKRPAPIEAAPGATIEEALQFGLRHLALRQSDTILRIKGVDLELFVGDEYPDVHKRYMARQFDAFAAEYEKNFIQRNWAMYSVALETLANVASAVSSPLRIVDMGCGTGVAMRGIFGENGGGRYFGIDPSTKMLDSLTAQSSNYPDVSITTRAGNAGLLMEAAVSEDIRQHLAGQPNIVCWLAVLHIINKDKDQPIGPLLAAAKDLMADDGRMVIANYFHKSQEDFLAFREKYMQTMIHEPTPPLGLFTPERMTEILSDVGLAVESCNETICKDGIRAYVMVAKKR
jgi:predicted TPR repeat methyltransferase